MTVYIVFAEDSSIDQVFMDKKQAEVYCARNEGREYEEHYTAEEKLKGDETVYYGVKGFFYQREYDVMDMSRVYSLSEIKESVNVDEKRGITVILPTEKRLSWKEIQKMLNEYRKTIKLEGDSE